MKKRLSILVACCAMAIVCFSSSSHANGVVPEASVVIVDQADGKGSINVKNTDNASVLLLTSIENVPEDTENLLAVTPPAIHVEPGKSQKVRFVLTTKEPLKTERLKLALFEGVPPKSKGKHANVALTVRRSLPVVIRPAGLVTEDKPWKQLEWRVQGAGIVVSNPSPYVVRLAQQVQTLPGAAAWDLPTTYVLPGQTLSLTAKGVRKPGAVTAVRIFPATTRGYSAPEYEAPLAR